VWALRPRNPPATLTSSSGRVAMFASLTRIGTLHYFRSPAGQR
jgi:hypothetical protein